MYTVPSTLTGFLFHFIKKNWLSFLVIQICAFAWTLDNTLWPKVIGMIISKLESYQGPREQIWDYIKDIVIVGAILWLTIELSFRLVGIMSMRVFPNFEADIRMAIFEYVSKQSYSYFTSNFAGSIANKISDLPRSSEAILSTIINVLIPAIASAIIITTMFAQLHPLFGMIIFVWMVCHLGICLLTTQKSQHYSNIHAESRSRLSGRIVDSIANNISVRIFARLKYESEFIKRFQNDEVAKYKESLLYIEKVRIVLGIMCFIFMGICLTWFEIYCYKKNIIDLGDLVFIFQASTQAVMVAWWAGLELPKLFQEIGVCKQALSLINTPLQVTDKPNAQPIQIKSGEIVFEDVTFRYERDNNLFQNKNVSILPSQKVGLVGFSGSGKTTFANLLLRYYDVQSGKILIDGQDISEVTQDSLREQIIMIPQEPILFHRSLMENIRYGNLNATNEEVVEASKKAHCHEFIMKLKDQYNTTVGERGLKLSGGQRQRIAIARALLKKAPILIMDEATASLDSATEKLIQESIKEITKNKTTIIIAHRLSTLADMDRILVFKDGSIEEDGTHEELLQANGYYTHLWNMQVGGIIPEQPEEEEEESEEENEEETLAEANE